MASVVVSLLGKVFEPHETHTLFSTTTDVLFKPSVCGAPERAVNLYDYGAFEFWQIFVGRANQYRVQFDYRPLAKIIGVLHQNDAPEPTPFDALLPTEQIVMVVRNASDKKQPFALVFAGEVIR